MSTSGSTDYSETTRTIIEDALIAIGAYEPGETPEHEEFEFARRQLNRMVKAWQALGFNLFRRASGEITLVANQQSYTMGGTAPDFAIRPLRIETMRFVQSDGTEAPSMIEISREDYDRYPNKDSQGTSTVFYYDPGRNQGTLYIWPVLAAVNGEKVKFTYQRTFEDFDAATNEPDIPQEWFDAIVMSLGAKLSPTYYPGKLEIQQGHKSDAIAALDIVASYDRENADIVFKLVERM